MATLQLGMEFEEMSGQCDVRRNVVLKILGNLLKTAGVDLLSRPLTLLTLEWGGHDLVED